MQVSTHFKYSKQRVPSTTVVIEHCDQHTERHEHSAGSRDAVSPPNLHAALHIDTPKYAQNAEPTQHSMCSQPPNLASALAIEVDSSRSTSITMQARPNMGPVSLMGIHQ
jgi:hypothetical protein